MITRSKFLLFLVTALIFLWPQNAGAIVLTFEEQPLGPPYPYYVGDSFLAKDYYSPTTIGIDVVAFEPNVGAPILDGFLDLGNSGMAGGFGKELELNNVDLIFNLNGMGCPSCSIYLFFGDHEGEVNLQIGDGTMYKLNDFTDLPPVVDGAYFVDIQGGTPLGTMLILTGQIDTFTIGGQELFLDNIVICTNVPEPATVVLLGLGSVILLRKRKFLSK